MRLEGERHFQGMSIIIKESRIQETSNDDEIDIWMIRDNLKLTPEERVAQHQNTLDFIEELKEAFLKSRAKPSSSPQETRS